MLPNMESQRRLAVSFGGLEPNEPRSHVKPKAQRLRRWFLVVVAVAAVAVIVDEQMGFRVARKLCGYSFAQEPNTYVGYWENAFVPDLDYGETRGFGYDAKVKSPYDVAYVVTIPSCPADLVEAHNDPGHAFYDAAAVLKYVTCQTLRDAGDKYSDCTFYAIVHPQATTCEGPDGTTYDRVKILENLGYWVRIWGGFIPNDEVQSDFLRENGDFQSLVALHAWRLTSHSIAVLTDFAALSFRRPHSLFDTFLGDQSLQAMYTRDYSSTSPPSLQNRGVSTDFLVFRPSVDTFNALRKTFTSTQYYSDSGWAGSGIEGTGAKGLLTYFFHDKVSGKEQDRCVYGNRVQDPIDPRTQTCRNGSEKCEDCRNKVFDDIIVGLPRDVCGEPWTCWYDENWDVATKALCEGYHRYWFENRKAFERKYMKNYLPPAGDFHKDVFLGYCSEKGANGYQLILPDNGVCLGETKSEAVSTVVPKIQQTQSLELVVPKFTGNGNACINGYISTPSYTPPFNIAVVIDISGSTRSTFGGTSIGDVNNDGQRNTILDAEIDATIKMVERLINTPGLSNSNVEVAIFTFSSKARFRGQFDPADPTNPTEINPELLTLLTGLTSGGITNFDDALDKAAYYFGRNAKFDTGTNLLYFLSDGKPNTCGDDDNEACTVNTNIGLNHKEALNYKHELGLLDKYNVVRHAIGVGSGSDVAANSGLASIDNTIDPITQEKAIKVMTTDALADTMTQNPVVGSVVDLQVYVNGNVQAGMDERSITTGPTGYAFGEFIVEGLKRARGATNVIGAVVTMDVDGDINTKDDQYSLSVKTTVEGSIDNWVDVS